MEYLNKNDWHARCHFYTTQSVHRKITRLMVWFQIEMFIIWQWILFINPCLFYCPCLSINTVQKGLFQIEMIITWQCILFYKPVPSRVQIQNPARLKSTENKKSTKNKETQVGTTHMRTDSLPVACYPSEQRLFLTHSLFFCTLQIHTIVLWQGNNVENDGNGDADFFSHTLFCFLALNRFTWYHAWQGWQRGWQGQIQQG